MMNFKRKPTVIKFNDEQEKQKFINWAFSKSEPNEKIDKVKDAMCLAQQHTISNSQKDKLNKTNTE